MQPFVAADANAFGPLLQSMPDPLARYQEQLAFKVGLDAKKAQAEFQRAQVSAAQQKIERTAQFQSAMQAYLANPSAQGLAQLLGAFPEFSEESKAAFGALDSARQKVDLTQIGEVAALASAGNYEKAAEAMRRRIQADGDDDPTDRLILEGLESGDPAKQKQALGLLTYGLGVAVGPEHAKSFLEVNGLSREPDLMAVAPGSEVIDRRDPSQSVYSSPYRPQTITDPTTGQVYQLVPKKGASGGAPSGGFDAAWAFTLKHEGGYNPHDGNGAPVNFGINQGANPDIDVRNLTPEQAKRIAYERYWKPSGAESLPPALQTIHFDTYYINPRAATNILKQSGGDPQRYIELRDRWFKSRGNREKYGKAWDSRTDALRGTVTGGPTQVRSKQEYDRLPKGAQYIAPDGSLRVKG